MLSGLGNATQITQSSGVVQLGQANNLASNTTFAVSASSVAPGTIIVIAGTAINGAAVTGVSDSKNGTYTQAVQSPKLVSRPAVSVFYKSNATTLIAGTDTISVMTSSGNYYASAIAVSGSYTADAIQSVMANAATKAKLLLPAAISPNEFVVGATMLDGPSGTFAAAPGFTSNTNPAGTVLYSAYANATSLPSGAAQWLSEYSFTASTLETGRIGYIVAWGGDEFGYAYTYALDGTQPSGVTVDSDTGILRIGTAIPAAGIYKCNVIVTNRIKAKQATFGISIVVKAGVTSGWTTGQILHKTYLPDSGTYGTPKGNNYTTVFNAINSQILADQKTVGDFNLRASVLLRTGKTYNYTNNAWGNGVQYLTVDVDPNFAGGANPICQCSITDYTFSDSQLATLNVGIGGMFDTMNGNIKVNCAPIASCSVGDKTVTLLNSSDASKLTVGRWHFVGSVDQQTGLVAGFPPNVRYFDFVKVVSISGTTVTLDRRLRHNHSQSNFEDTTDDNSVGVARIMCWDVGGTSINSDTTLRLTIRSTWRNITFLANTFYKGTDLSAQGMQLQDTLDLSLENCNLIHIVVSQCQHARCINCTITTDCEFDKDIETVVLDGGNWNSIAGVSGVEYLLYRNISVGTQYISPRQWRTIGTIMDGSKDVMGLGINVTSGQPGPISYFDFESTTWKPTPSANITGSPSIDNVTLTLRKDGTISGSTLTIPQAFGTTTMTAFERWEGWIHEGMLVWAGTGIPPITSKWGYISRLYGTPGKNIKADLVWCNGTIPTTGTLTGGRGDVWRLAANCTYQGGVQFNANGYARQITTPGTGVEAGTNYNYPTGYPIPAPALALSYAPSWVTARNMGAAIVGFRRT
jgi:hypothetical protein